MAVGATDGWTAGSAVAGSVVGVAWALQAAKKIAVITTAKNAIAVRFLGTKDKGLLFSGDDVRLFDMCQVFPHVQHLHGVGGPGYSRQEAVDDGHYIGIFNQSAV